jgi:hypothetical protein
LHVRAVQEADASAWSLPCPTQIGAAQAERPEGVRSGPPLARRAYCAWFPGRTTTASVPGHPHARHRIRTYAVRCAPACQAPGTASLHEARAATSCPAVSSPRAHGPSALSPAPPRAHAGAGAARRSVRQRRGGSGPPMPQTTVRVQSARRRGRATQCLAPLPVRRTRLHGRQAPRLSEVSMVFQLHPQLGQPLTAESRVIRGATPREALCRFPHFHPLAQRPQHPGGTQYSAPVRRLCEHCGGGSAAGRPAVTSVGSHRDCTGKLNDPGC